MIEENIFSNIGVETE